LRRRRVRHGGREHRRHGHGRQGQKAVSSRHGHRFLSLCLVSAAGSAPATAAPFSSRRGYLSLHGAILSTRRVRVRSSQAGPRPFIRH
jgi:hypothetical protein